MSIHIKVTALKTASAGGKAKVSKGGKKAAKGQAPFGLSLSSAKGRGFKGKLRAVPMAGAGKKGVRGRGLSSSFKGFVSAHRATVLDNKSTLRSRDAVFSTKRIKSAGKSVTTGKAEARKKSVQAQAGDSALYLPAPSQTSPRLHKKKIVSLYKKSASHQGVVRKGLRGGSVGRAKGVIHKIAARPVPATIGKVHLKAVPKGIRGKAVGKFKGVIPKISTGSKPLRAESANLGKGHVKVVSKGPIAQKFDLKGNIPTDKAQVEGKAKLSKAGKGRAGPQGRLKIAIDEVSGKSGHIKRTKGEIKQAIASAGPLERLTEVQAKKSPLKKPVEQSPVDKPIEPSLGLPAKSVSLKARAAALSGGLIPHLKGVPLNKGAVKKSRTALVSSHALKKAGGKFAALKKKRVKALRREGGTSVKAVFEAQPDTLKGMSEVREGGTLSEGLLFAGATPLEKAPQGGLARGNGKAVFKDPSAILNAGIPIATERGQARAGVLTAAPNHDLAGRERELVDKASGGVLISLRRADREIVIKLSPAELGKMEIKVKVHHGLVEASILVDNPDVLAMLNANNTALKDQLARQGLMLGGLEVALNRQDTTPQGGGELNHGEGGRYGRGRQAVKGVGQTGDVSMAQKAPSKGGAQGGLDLFI